MRAAAAGRIDEVHGVAGLHGDRMDDEIRGIHRDSARRSGAAIAHLFATGTNDEREHKQYGNERECKPLHVSARPFPGRFYDLCAHQNVGA